MFGWEWQDRHSYGGAGTWEPVCSLFIWQQLQQPWKILDFGHKFCFNPLFVWQKVVMMVLNKHFFSYESSWGIFHLIFALYSENTIYSVVEKTFLIKVSGPTEEQASQKFSPSSVGLTSRMFMTTPWHLILPGKYPPGISHELFGTIFYLFGYPLRGTSM